MEKAMPGGAVRPLYLCRTLDVLPWLGRIYIGAFPRSPSGPRGTLIWLFAVIRRPNCLSA